MKKLISYLPALGVLAVLLAFALWVSASMQEKTTLWQEQLLQADALAQSDDWTGAMEVLMESYQDWDSHQTYLHIVTEHDAVDDAQSMYHRAMAFAATRELSEFRAELSDLRDQLRLLAEMERFSIKNVL